ncbi:hypothetical protein KKF69_05690 [Patescibacteria group bacterium]|nr:hypothetical protein [Patescibacteria group bacterium]
MNKNTLIKKYFQKSHLLKIENPQYQKTVETLFNWLLTSDHAENDITAKFLDNKTIKATIKTKQDIIAAGIEEIEYLLKKYPEISFQKKVTDGEKIKKGDEIAIISGDNRTILSLERTILNILQRMSGIATQTQKLTKLLYPVHIAPTRKTPWMLLDKKAVAAGGGLTHRLNLSDGILIKDNHLQILKNENNLKNEEQTVTHALKMILPQITNTSIEIEVTTKEGANSAIKTFFHSHCHSREGGNPLNSNNTSLTIMLDNWTAKDVRNFIKEVNTNPYASSIIFEASGNINESNLKHWAQTGVDIISSGALTHSAKAADLSLSIL